MAADYEDGTVQPENGRQQAGRRRGGSTGQDRVGLLLVIGLIILAVILIFAIYQSRRVSSSYTVTNEIGGNVYGSDSYEVMGSNIIRYSRDGITLINSDGDALWNQTFGMSDPIISVGSTYIAIGDRGASSLYIFDQSGEVSEITTDVKAMVDLVKSENNIPCAIGFGISTPQQAHDMAAVSDGAIVGSAVIKIIEKYGKDSPEYVGEYVRSMKEAL